MNQVFHLYQLQKVDTQISQFKKRIAEIDETIQADTRLRNAEKIVNQAKLNLEKLNRELRSLEETGKEIRLEVEFNEGSLYSGKIRNPKELNDIQSKVTSDKKRFAQVEEQQLALMMKIEEKEEEFARLEKLLVDVKSRVATSHAQLLGEKSQLEKQTATLMIEKKAKRTPISDSANQLYSDLLAKKNGIAVALVEDRACTLCGAPLTPGDWQALRSTGKITFCSTCGRILYAS